MASFLELDDHHLEGEVLVLPTAFGGRQTPIASGYRGQFFWHINGQDCTDWLAETYFENDEVAVGESTICKIKLCGSILDFGRSTGFPIGRQFALREGSRIVAVGVLTRSRFDEVEG